MDSLYSLIPNRKAWPVLPAWQRLRVMLEAGRTATICGALVTLEVDRDALTGAESPSLLIGVVDGDHYRGLRHALKPVLLNERVLLIPRVLRLDGGRLVGALIELQTGFTLPARRAA